jgi:hypothetical protein
VAKPTLVLKVGFLFIWGIMNREGGIYRKSLLKATVVALSLIALIIIPVAQALNGFAAAAADDELLENGGFESGESFWQTYGGDLTIICSCEYHDYVRSGGFAARFTLEPNRLESWIYQDLDRDSFVPGQTYNLTGYYLAEEDPNIGRIFLRIYWYDEKGNEISHHEDSSTATSDDHTYRPLSIPRPPDIPDPVLAPLNASRARIEAGVTRLDVTQSVTVYFDDLSFTGPTDTTPPSMPTNVHKTTPDNDNTPCFTWDHATDDLAGVAGYSIKIDDAEWTSIGNVTSWTSPYPVPDGYHVFFVKATDNVDNEGEAGQAAFGIDTTPPSMPANVHKTTPDNVNTPCFTWDPATDALAGVAGYSIRIDDAEWTSIGNVTSWTSPYPVPDGDHVFFVKAMNNVGDEGEAGSVSFSIDTTPPSMPANVHKTTPDSDNAPCFTWDTATDALAGVAGYSIRIDDAEWTSIGNVTSWTSPYPIPDGDHVFFVKATDKVGNEGEAGQAAFGIDTAPPSMPANVHKTTPDNVNTPCFTWDPATDLLAGVAGYSIRINDDEWTSIGNVTSWTSPHPVPNGNYTFFVKATDKAGNEGEAGSVSFSINTTASDGEPPPQPSPTSGMSWLQTVLVPTLASMGVVCLILAFWLRKRGR